MQCHVAVLDTKGTTYILTWKERPQRDLSETTFFLFSLCVPPSFFERIGFEFIPAGGATFLYPGLLVLTAVVQCSSAALVIWYDTKLAILYTYSSCVYTRVCIMHIGIYLVSHNLVLFDVYRVQGYNSRRYVVFLLRASA